jgi:hypothetical protein
MPYSLENYFRVWGFRVNPTLTICHTALLAHPMHGSLHVC